MSMNLDPFGAGPRWWRILIHGAFTITLVLGGFAAVLIGGGVVWSGSDPQLNGARETFVSVSAIVGLGCTMLRMGYSFGRDTIALCQNRPTGQTGSILTLVCGYCAITGIVLASVATRVPLWGSVLMVSGPPTVLLVMRWPHMRRQLRMRLTARAASRASRPATIVRKQRVVKRKTRAQRRR